MNEEELKFVDDKLFVYTPLPQYGDGICKVQLVMTKEIFQECYRRWVEPQEISNRNLKLWHDIYAEEKRREGD